MRMIKFKIPQKLSIFLSKKYLDYAESLPKFGGTFIATLQTIREHQRIESERDYKESRPPEGIKIEYIGFRLIEIFHLEEFEILQKGILQLFPGLKENYISRNFAGEFENFAETINTGGMRKLGVVFRDKKGRLYSLESVEIKDLPVEVEYIELALHKFFPSMLVLTLDVRLNNKATSNILSLHDAKCLSDITFRHLTPWRLERSGYSQNSTENIRTEKIVNWINELHKGVEKCIMPFFKTGYFIQQHAAGKVSSLPAINLYRITGLPDKEESFKNLVSSARAWWHSFGFDFYGILYGNKEVIFSESAQDGSVFFNVIALQGKPEEAIKSGRLDEKITEHIYIINDILDAILPCISTVSFLKSSRRSLEKMRQVIFRSMKYRLLPALNKYIKIESIIRFESMLLRRTSMEFNQNKNYILHDLKGIDEFNVMKTSCIQKQGMNFRDALLESVNFNMKRLNEHISLIKSEFSEYLTVQNMKKMYSLQRWIFLFTAIVTIATLLAYWNTVVASLKGIFDWLLQNISSKKF